MQVERFNFREFSEGNVARKLHGGKGKGQAPDQPPPPPTFSEEQIKVAERESYKKGFLDGVQDGRKQAESEQAAIDRKLTETVSAFAQKLAPMLVDYRRIALEIKELAPQIGLAIARKVAGKALEENAATVITEVAFRACETVAAEPKITVTVHESLATALTYRLEQLAANLPAATDIEVNGDAQMPLADCKVEWKNGSMARNTEQLWQQIEQAAETMSQAARRDTEEQLDLLQAPLPAGTIASKKE